jgi:hypothetical protein
MAANGSSREFEEGIVAHEVLGGLCANQGGLESGVSVRQLPLNNADRLSRLTSARAVVVVQAISLFQHHGNVSHF